MITLYNVKDIYAPIENREILERPLFETSVSAGFPSPARDYIENSLDLNELMVPNPASTYFMKVDGYSMIGANICPGDIVVVDRSLNVSNNKIIVAVLDGEMTIKRLKMINNEYWLYPENNNYRPVKVDSWMDFIVWGIVTWVIHRAR